MNFDENILNQLPETVPLLPVRDIVVFPYMIIPLYVGRESSICGVEESLSKNRLIFLSSQKDPSNEIAQEDDLYKTGTIAMIMRMRKLPDGRLKILVQGLAKGKVKKFHHFSPYIKVGIKKVEEVAPQISMQDEELAEREALVRQAKEQIEKVVSVGKSLSPDILLVLEDVNEPGRLADLIASNLGLPLVDAQNILETDDPKKRLQLVNELLSNELEVLQVQTRIRNTAKDEMTKSQREYFLREQLRVIKNELGDSNSKDDEVDGLREKIVHAGMPEETEKEVLKQLSRLEKMHPDASEASMIRTYIDLIADLPWAKSSQDKIDLEEAQKILDEDHHELTKAKDRVLEFLAVRKLKKDNLRGPILCFSGPPGVGKTSLGRSIARAMGRKYARIALGGVKDEAEVRGHRRTYVGAMPGKIIQTLKQVGVNNPVIVLDEVDKLGSDFRGDPSAAMLEVLDPEQNATFRDNYMNADFDLSNCLFIATANVHSDIPAALRDRMETIHISGYTEGDKLHISKKHLVSRQIEANGIGKDNIEFTDEGLSYLISHYTREAGLRNLEREIGSLCRKIAKKVVTGEKEKFLITPESVSELLGPPRFIKDRKLEENRVGIATGLAWTQAGGEILYVEALKMKGKGDLVLTGQLGDIMKESAKAAQSYAKAHAKELGIDSKWFEENEVHIHLPAGAIPKDGPSAGVTMATTLISLMTSTPIRKNIAMTGEISLAGRVLPVGGIKEKCLAALNHGITDIILPIANQKDVQDIPQEFKASMKFMFVENLDEVLALALAKEGAADTVDTADAGQELPAKERKRAPSRGGHAA